MRLARRRAGSRGSCRRPCRTRRRSSMSSGTALSAAAAGNQLAVARAKHGSHPRWRQAGPHGPAFARPRRPLAGGAAARP
eukprot:3572551-Heterocapsa_arctica.AAC.1